MNRIRIFWLCIIICISNTYGQNLIVNGDAEISPFTDNGWVQVSGNWQQRASNPLPQNGSNYFFAGANASAELYQEINVSDDQIDIDAGNLRFTFSCYLRSFPQTQIDESRVTVEYLNVSGDVLAGYDTDFQSNTSEWILFNDTRIAPVGTRTIKITLFSIRNHGSNNDGYSDNLQLTKEQVLSTEQLSNLSKELVLYPNPSNNFIQISGLVATESYKIYNIIGAEVENGATSEDKKIYIQNLSNGLYILKFSNGSILKFIKE